MLLNSKSEHWKKSSAQICSLDVQFIQQDLIGHNQNCVKRNFEKSHMKSDPSNMVLICSIYETRLIGRQSKMFKRDLRQKLHEVQT